MHFWVAADAERALAELRCGASVNAQTDLGVTPLHFAASGSDNPAVIEVLLENGANINAQNFFGDTPLHFAAYGSLFPGIVQVLLDNGANANARNAVGSSPLDMALGRHEEIAQILAKYSR